MTNRQELHAQTRQLLRDLIQQPEERIDLAEAALLIAAGEYPDLDRGKYIRRLDTMAETVRQRIGSTADPRQIIAEINQYLFQEEGFSGNSEDYYDPRNSFLNEVLERKTGIPITLSTVYLEIAWRLKFPLFGVGMPGHFLVKHPHCKILIDPFAKGRIRTEEDCWEQMKQLLGESVPVHKSYLEGVGKRQIVTRMLNNLRSIYLNTRQFHSALNITETALALNPESLDELKQKAMLLLRLHRYSEALAGLNHYLAAMPEAKDAEEIRQTVTNLKKVLAQMN